MENLSFEVVAVPQDDVDQPNSTKATPINFKVRLKKRDKTDVYEKGAISVAKLKRPTVYPEKIRLVDSVQTIMSFNMLMEPEFNKKPSRKPQKLFHLFKTGKCLGTQNDNDDDDPPYMITNKDKADNIKSKSLELDKEQRLSFSNNYSNNHPSKGLIIKTPKAFLGKCKPGGCLDPPFSEDTYKYKPALRTKSSVPKIKPKLNLQMMSYPKPDKLDESKTSVTIVKPPNEDAHNISSTHMLYQAKSRIESLNEISSDLIITYPPEIPLRGISTDKNASSRNISIETNRLVNNNTDTYFMPPKMYKSSNRKNSKGKSESYKNNNTTYYKQKEEFIDSGGFKDTPSLLKQSIENDNLDTSMFDETLSKKDFTLQKQILCKEAGETITKFTAYADSNLLKRKYSKDLSLNISKDNVTSGIDVIQPHVDKSSIELNKFETEVKRTKESTKRDSKQKYIAEIETPTQKEFLQNNKINELNENNFAMGKSLMLCYDKDSLSLKEKSDGQSVKSSISATGNIKEKGDESHIPSSRSQNNIKSDMEVNVKVFLKLTEDNLQPQNFVEPSTDLQNMNDQNLKSKQDNLTNLILESSQSYDGLSQMEKINKSQVLQKGNQENLRQQKENQVFSDSLEPYIGKNNLDSVTLNDSNEKVSIIDTTNELTDNFKKRLAHMENTEDVDDMTKNSSKDDFVKDKINLDNLKRPIFYEQESIKSLKIKTENENFINMNKNIQSSRDVSYTLQLENYIQKPLTSTSNSNLASQDRLRSVRRPVSEISKFADNYPSEDVKNVSSAIIRDTSNIDLNNRSKDIPQDDRNVDLTLSQIDDNFKIKVRMTSSTISFITHKNGFTLNEDNPDFNTLSPQAVMTNKNKDILPLKYVQNDEQSSITNEYKSDNKIFDVIRHKSTPDVISQRDDIQITNLPPKSSKIDSIKSNLSAIGKDILLDKELDVNNKQSMEVGTWSKLSQDITLVPINQGEESATSDAPTSSLDSVNMNSIGKVQLGLLDNTLNNKKVTIQSRQSKDIKRGQKEESLKQKKRSDTLENIAQDQTIIDFAFQTYLNENNQKVIKTVDISNDPQRFSNDSISIIKNAITPNTDEMSFAISSETKISLQINKPSTVMRLGKTPISTKIKDASAEDGMKSAAYQDNISHISFSDIEALQKTLSAVYEKNLVPVEKLIKSLISDIDRMAGYRFLSKKSVSIKKLRPLKQTYSGRCGCLRR